MHNNYLQDSTLLITIWNASMSFTVNNKKSFNHSFNKTASLQNFQVNTKFSMCTSQNETQNIHFHNKELL